MAIADAIDEAGKALAGDKSLLPVFKAGEALTIQRTVDGKNVLMSVIVTDPCSLSARRMTLTAVVRQWGVSSYADGRVANQAASIARLLKHLQAHCWSADCPHRTASDGPVQEGDPQLGLATTEQLLNELDARLRVHYPKTDTLTPWPEVADLRRQLTPEQMAYRTVDQ